MDIPTATKLRSRRPIELTTSMVAPSHLQLFGRGENGADGNMLKSWPAVTFRGYGGIQRANQEAIRGLTGQGISDPKLAQRLGAMGKAVFEGLGPRALGDIDGSDDRPRRRSV